MANVAVPAEPDASGDLDFLGDIYFNFDALGDLDLFPDAPSVVDTAPPGPPGAPAETVRTQMMDEVERFLMEEEAHVGGGDDQPLPGDFFADVFFAGSDEGSVKSAVSESDAATPGENAVEGLSGGKARSGEGSEPEVNAAASVAESEKETNGDESEGKGGEDEDLLSRKRRRQMRNRDSAVKSRERKKIYVRDLEMKSKFFESECRRLLHALHCCTAENIALRQCLQKPRALGTPLAKQESAVLFVGKMLIFVEVPNDHFSTFILILTSYIFWKLKNVSSNESLLLGSLFWLVSILCLFLMPSGPAEVTKNASGVARSNTQVIGTKGLRSEGRLDQELGSEFSLKKRKCKALRTKMKICFFPIGLASG